MGLVLVRDLVLLRDLISVLVWQHAHNMEVPDEHVTIISRLLSNGGVDLKFGAVDVFHNAGAVVVVIGQVSWGGAEGEATKNVWESEGESAGAGWFFAVLAVRIRGPWAEEVRESEGEAAGAWRRVLFSCWDPFSQDSCNNNTRFLDVAFLHWR